MMLMRMDACGWFPPTRIRHSQQVVEVPPFSREVDTVLMEMISSFSVATAQRVKTVGGALNCKGAHYTDVHPHLAPSEHFSCCVACV